MVVRNVFLLFAALVFVIALVGAVAVTALTPEPLCTLR